MKADKWEDYKDTGATCRTDCISYFREHQSLSMDQKGQPLINLKIQHHMAGNGNKDSVFIVYFRWE